MRFVYWHLDYMGVWTFYTLLKWLRQPYCYKLFTNSCWRPNGPKPWYFNVSGLCHIFIYPDCYCKQTSTFKNFLFRTLEHFIGCQFSKRVKEGILSKLLEVRLHCQVAMRSYSSLMCLHGNVLGPTHFVNLQHYFLLTYLAFFSVHIAVLTYNIYSLFY